MTNDDIFSIDDLTPCTYCGIVATSIDHVPPTSIRESLYAEDPIGMRKRFPEATVPCCHECNTLLGARWPWTIQARKAEIKKILKKRYQRILNLPTWTDAEISRCEGYLQKKLLFNLRQQEIIRERLAW